MKQIALVIHNENASTRETAAYLAEQGYTIYQVETLQDSELAAVTGDIQNKEGALDLPLLRRGEGKRIRALHPFRRKPVCDAGQLFT